MAMMRYVVLVGVLAFSLLGGVARAQEYRGPTRINLDERLIQGQTIKSGLIYIFDRQELDIDSLIKKQRAFRARTIRTVFEE